MTKHMMKKATRNALASAAMVGGNGSGPHPLAAQGETQPGWWCRGALMAHNRSERKAENVHDLGWKDPANVQFSPWNGTT